MARIVNVHVITRLELGGAQQNTLYTVTHLDPSRYRTYLVSGRGGLMDAEASSQLGNRLIFLDSLIREVRPWTDFLALLGLVVILRQIQKENQDLPVVVHTHSSKAGILGRIAARLAGIRETVHTYHGFGFHDFQKKVVRTVFILLERIAARITKRQVFVSRDNERVGRELGLVTTESRVIRSGIPFRVFRGPISGREKIRRELGISGAMPVVTTIACFKPQKAPLDFVAMADAVRRDHPSVLFLMAGDGELRPRVEAEISRRGLQNHIYLLGWRRDVHELLSGSDIFVLSSLWEGLPRVLIEASLSGLPIVTTDIDGASEIVREGETGFIVPRKDYLALARKVLYLLQNPVEAEKMGTAARAVPPEFDIDEMVRAQERLYADMVL